MAERKRKDLDGGAETQGQFAGVAGETREEVRRAKRMMVLTTGARMFNERGYDRTKLDDIAAELNVSKRTLYYYIKNKDDILFQCNTMAWEELLPTLAVCADRTIAPLERIRLLMKAYARVLSEDYGACQVLTHENVLGREGIEVLRKIWRRLDQALRGLVEEGIADGSIAPCVPKYASAALFGAFNWLPHWRSATRRPTYEEVGDAFLDVFLNGLKATRDEPEPAR